MKNAMTMTARIIAVIVKAVLVLLFGADWVWLDTVTSLLKLGAYRYLKGLSWARGG
jgi:hypothetical protein